MPQQPDWLKDAETQKLGIESIPDNIAAKAEAWEKVGFCYCRASRQAGDPKEFRRVRELAGEAYRNAASLFEEGGNKGRSSQCSALAEYAYAWLASDPVDRLRILDTCRKYGAMAREALKKTGDELNYGRSCIDLLVYISELISMTSGQEEKHIITEEGLECAEEGISALSKLEDKEELLRAYPEVSLHYWYVANIREDAHDREEMAAKCLEYADKALALSKELDIPSYTAMSRWAAALGTLFFTGRIEVPLEHGKEMLLQASDAGDNFLIGAAYYVLAYIADWMIRGEENPDEKRSLCEEVISHCEEAIRHLEIVSLDSMIAEAHLFYAQRYSTLASDFATNRSEKLSLSRKAIEVGRKGLDHAVRSGSTDAMAPTYHALSKALYSHSNQETGKEEKERLLQEALKHREAYLRTVTENFPSNEWVLGVGKVYSGQIKADLSRLETPGRESTQLLGSAVVDMDDGVRCCLNWIASRPSPSMIIAVAGFEDWYGRALEELFLLTQDEKVLRKANEVYADAADRFGELGMSSRVAESYWKIAKNHDRLEENHEASRYFDRAFREYRATAAGMPSFSDFFLDYAQYMRAWSEIEKAKIARNQGDHSSATRHYRTASNRLKGSKSWNYLSPNFRAWSSLERAEDLSRRERTANSIEAFGKAAELFREAKSSLRVALDTVEASDQKDLIQRLIPVSDQREEYCIGRLSIEEAKSLDRKGKHAAASERYGSAAATFEKIVQKATEHGRRELLPILYLCQAWQKMLNAEAKSSPEMYEEAAELFVRVREHALDQEQSLLALGHGSFCRALAAGTEYEITRDNQKYAEAKRHMEIAASSYLKSGLETAAEYANGTQRLLDAYVLMENAKLETDPVKTARLFAMAEKVLEYSAGSFRKANHPEKVEQVRQLVVKIKEERELAVMLGDIMRAPAVVSSTESFATLTLSEEQAVGLESFEGTNIQATLVCEFTEIRAGEDLNLEVHIVNVGREIIQLAQVEGIIPSSFEAVSLPSYCSVEESRISLKSRRLDPMKTEEIRLVLRSFTAGSFPIEPSIRFVDETGEEMYLQPEPVTISILEVSLAGRVETGFSDLDKLLFGGMPENYSVILSSPTCDERDILVDRFLKAGTERGDITLHITTGSGRIGPFGEDDESRYLLLCNPRASELVKDAPNVFKTKAIENLTETNIALARVFRVLDGIAERSRVACVEVVSDILLHHKAVQTRRWLGELLTELKAKGFTSLATVNPQMHPTEDLEAVLGLFEGEISIREEEDGPGRFMKVARMVNQEYLQTEILLRRGRFLRPAETTQLLAVRRIPTGSVDLDRLLDGGLPQGYSVVLTSPPCDERDSLIRKFLEEGARAGQVVFFITMDLGGLEALVEEYRSNFHLVICNPQANIMMKDLPNVTKLTGVVNLTNINLALLNAHRRLGQPRGPNRICVAIVSDVLLQHQAVTTRKWLTELVPDLRSRGFTTLATVNPQMHPSEDLGAVLGLFEGEIIIHERKTKRGEQKFLRVSRMYNQEYLGDDLPLSRSGAQQAEISRRLL